MTTNIALDTNAYSALQKGNKIVSETVRKSPFVGLPVIVFGELFYGIFDGNKTEENSKILDKFINIDRVNILHIDEMTAKIFGEIATELKKIGKPIQQNDIWIAALCKQHDYSLITNDGGFQNITGLQTITF